MVVVKIADQDVADKIDTQYIETQFSGLENIGIVFVCTREDDGEDDDWTDDAGVRHLVIRLPYEEVFQAKDVQKMMLMMAQERLENQ
jgi:hypothetical protein